MSSLPCATARDDGTYSLCREHRLYDASDRRRGWSTPYLVHYLGNRAWTEQLGMQKG